MCFWIFAQMFSESELCTNYSTAPDPSPSFPLISSLLSGHQLPDSSHHKAARGVLLNYPSAPLPCSEPSLGSPVPSGGSPSSFLGFQDLSLSGSCCPFPARPSTLATFHLPSLSHAVPPAWRAFLLHPGHLLLTHEASAHRRDASPESCSRSELPRVRSPAFLSLRGICTPGFIWGISRATLSFPNKLGF